jgi:hypothetical protein
MAFSLAPQGSLNRFTDALAQLVENDRCIKQGDPSFWGTAPLSVLSANTGFLFGSANARAVIQNAGTATGDISVAANALYDGANWTRQSTARPSLGFLVTESSNIFLWRHAAAAAGNIAWTEIMRLSTAELALNNNMGFNIRNSAGNTITGVSLSATNQMAVGSDNAAAVNDTTLSAGQSVRFRTNGAERMSISNIGAVGIYNSLTLGAAGTPVTQIRVYTPNLAPALVAANTTAEQNFPVAGLATTDTIFLNKPTHQVGLSIGNVRAAADTLYIEYTNTSGAGITPTGQVYRIVAVRS